MPTKCEPDGFVQAIIKGLKAIMYAAIKNVSEKSTFHRFEKLLEK